MKPPLKKSVLIVVLAVVVTMPLGCGVRVEVPEHSSITELKNKTLAYLDEMETAFAEGKVGLAQVRGLSVHINWLKNHMKTLDVGTPEQHQALDEILWKLGRESEGMRGHPPDLEPGGKDVSAPPAPFEGKSVRELIPQIRKIVESIPDSDRRPEVPSPGE